VSDGLDPRLLRWITVGGTRTRYLESGDGPLLVLVHGGEIGSLYSLDCWSLALPLLSTHFKVIAPDRIGQGFTANPNDLPYRPAMMLDHMRQFLEVLGIRQAHIVGHSRGGLIGAWLALEHPDLVRTLTVVASRSLAPADPTHPNHVFYDNLGHRARLLAGEITAETVSAEPRAQSYDPETVTDDFVARMLEIAALPKSVAARRHAEAGRRATWLKEIEELRSNVLERIDRDGLPVPTQLLWGRDDLSAPPVTGLALFERVAVRTPDSELRVLNRARHYLFRDRPDAFATAVVDFADRH
jgi:2-hydroxy-6-oxo-octa-2,4-dienoate hydrolase